MRFPTFPRRFALPLLAAASALAFASPASSSPVPSAGVKIYNAPLCGPNAWVRVQLPASEFTVHDSAGTCIRSMRHRLDFQVSAVTERVPWQYPNISSGYELGESSCASSRDACYSYPVRQEDDGMPVASVKAWLAPGIYNLSFDTWFSPDRSHVSYQDRTGATELMVWLDHPGIDDRSHYDWSVTIDGIRWGVMTWEAGLATGHPWRYVAYVAPRTRLGSYSRRDLWLNPLFRDAIAHGYLRKEEWLTAIDLGFEIVSGGVFDNISRYSLTGVR